jgi:outer membrane protein, multidrug efflux system
MRKTFALAAATLLAGCNMAPHYARPALPVPVAPPQGPAYAPNEAGTVEAADVAWRDFFVDDRLRRLIALALANNRDLRIAVANAAQTQAQYRVQRAGLFPTIGLNGTATYQKYPAGLGGIAGAGGGGGAGGIGGGAGTGGGAVSTGGSSATSPRRRRSNISRAARTGTQRRSR